MAAAAAEAAAEEEEERGDDILELYLIFEYSMNFHDAFFFRGGGAWWV